MNKYIFTSLLSLFVIVGFISFINPHTASAQPLEWEEFDLSPNEYNSIAYGNGVYVAVGSGTPMYSSDGKNWNMSILPNAASLSSVVYGDGKFVAVGRTGSPLMQNMNRIIYLSSDGLSWDIASSIPDKLNAQSNLLSIFYMYDNLNAKDLFVAFGQDYSTGAGSTSLPYIVYSSDGDAWLRSTLPIGSDGSPSDAVVGYNENGELVLLSFVYGYGIGAPSYYIMSIDGGATWVYPDSLTGLDDFQGLSMSYLNGKFFYVGHSYDDEEGKDLFSVRSSMNGLDWDKGSIEFPEEFLSGSRETSAYGDNTYLFFLSPSLGYTPPLYSPNGETWEFFTPSFDKSSYVSPIQLIYAEDSFMLLGRNESGGYVIAFPKSLNDSSEIPSSKSSSIFGTRFCTAGVTTFCRPQNGFTNNNPLVNIYTELLGLYQQLLNTIQNENS
ncbi:MAG: hypothetical protein PHC89_00200 [Candidatus Pacebacteria bacterium]|nr:hypothetical protein [Candidatus Paceibacterota bacterium]